MRRAETRAKALRGAKPLFLEMVARERVASAAQLAQKCGLQAVRYFFYMHCRDLANLPQPVYPDGITTRSLNPQSDAASFVAADNDAFSDHWGFVAVTREQVDHWLSSSAFSPDNAILAVDEAGRIAGFCQLLFPEMEGTMLASNPPLVDDLGVVHDFRRRGIGRALLLSGMHRVRALGFDKVALAVDADNPNQALRLYESVGFQVVSRSTAFRKPL
jgi:mycothiol synthase